MNESFDSKLVDLIQWEFRFCVDPHEIADSVIESCVFHAVQASSKIMPTRKLARDRIKRELEKAFDRWDGKPKAPSNESNN